MRDLLFFVLIFFCPSVIVPLHSFDKKIELPKGQNRSNPVTQSQRILQSRDGRVAEENAAFKLSTEASYCLR